MFLSHSVTIPAATGTPASASQGYRGGPARLRPGCARDRGHGRREEGPRALRPLPAVARSRVAMLPVLRAAGKQGACS